MGGSVNLQGGGQYSMPNIQGYGQNAANIGQSAAGFGSRFGNRFGDRGYGPPPQYDGGYGDFGDYGGVSTGGKGFQQQPQYQPAPVMQPYVDQVSQGGKGFQPRQTPSQSVAYAPMNIPQMQLAQPGFYYPNIGSQMANLNANYGMGGLGAMGAFGNYPMMPRQPAPMQMYPALQPVAPQPTSTGGKGMRTKPPGGMQPSRPGYGPPTQPGYPPVGTGGKGFQPNPPYQPPDEPPYQPPEPPRSPSIQNNARDLFYQDMINSGMSADAAMAEVNRRYGPAASSQPTDNILRPVRPDDGKIGYTGPNGTVAQEYDRPPLPDSDYLSGRTPGQRQIETTMPTGMFGGLGSLGSPTGLPPAPPSMPVHEAGQNYQQNYDRYQKEMQNWQSQTGMSPDQWYAQRDENIRRQNDSAATLPPAPPPDEAQGQSMQTNAGLLNSLFT
ncbi:MAG: hypothetical protein EBW12_07000 [Actinobacteria bacterium]|nr:hypothetical protein [Actinomycetota bacterium]